MRFGRVDGHLHWVVEETRTSLHLTVLLETSSGVRVVREESIQPASTWNGDQSLNWIADQYAQETIAVDLALEGWEVVGASDLPETESTEVARSATYTVRMP